MREILFRGKRVENDEWVMEIIGNIYDNPELLGGETNARIS